MRTRKVIGVLLFSGLLLAGCGHKQEKQPVKEIVKVTVLPVTTSSQAGERTYAGTVEEGDGSSLSFASMGTVAKVMVGEGSAVRRGQTLAVLDQSTLKNTHEIAKQSLAQAEDALERMKLLHDNGSLPDIKWVEVQTQVAQARAAEQIARKNMGDAALKAPFDGYIAERNVDPGNNVVPGQACFKLVKLGQVKVKISVPETEVSKIKIGQNIRFTVAALSGRSFTGRVSEKGVEANPLSHTYDVYLSLANPGRVLMPGMVCNVTLNTAGGHDMVVPQQAVMIDGKRTFVWIVQGKTAHKREVTSLGVNSQGVITGGLNEGDLVIIEGQNKVSEGREVSYEE